MKKILGLVLLCLLTPTAHAEMWEYGKLWEAYEYGAEGKDIIASWVEGNTPIESAQDLTELYANLNTLWDLGLPISGYEGEMDVIALLGKQGWEMIAFNQTFNPGDIGKAIWYFKRPMESK